MKMKFFFLLFLIIANFTYGQTVINYQTWTGASGCNIFSSQVNVPASQNGSSTTIPHLANIGQPEYSGGSVDAISLECKAVIDIYGNTTGYKGTEYRINYNFKAGFSYVIVINAACINSGGTGSNANLRILANSGGSTTSSQCNGPNDIDQNTSGNLYRNNVLTSGTTYQNYSYSYSVFSSNESYLNYISSTTNKFG